MKLLKNERGQMLIMTAIELALLIGFLALAADVGVLFHTKRQMQIAADAAATAGAVNELDGGVSVTTLSDTTVADNAAAANGYLNTYNATTDPDGVKVQVNGGDTGNSMSAAASHTGSGYVEVIISKPDPLYFFKLFTGNNTATVAARAVAGDPGTATDCAFLMDPTGNDMQLQGADTITSKGCGWYINSNGTATGATTNQTGGASTVIAPYISSVGPAGTTSLGGTPVYSGVIPQSAPPLQSVGAVPPGDCTTTYAGTTMGTSSSTTTTSTLPPTIDGNDGVVCFSNDADISGETLSNGVFVFENGVTAGNPTGDTNMTNATLEVYGGAFTQNSNSNLNMTAPTALPGATTATFPPPPATGGLSYNGVALLVPAANTYYTDGMCLDTVHGNQDKKYHVLNVQIGSSNETLNGYIVAPDAAVFLNDNGGGIKITGFEAACLYDKSSSITITSYNTAHPDTTPLRVVALVE